jgi:hypothetical protein
MQKIQAKATKWLGISAVVALTAVGTTAEAASYIQGTIAFAGTANVRDSSNNLLVSDLSTSDNVVFPAGGQFIAAATVDFTALAGGSVAFNNFDFNPSLNPNPVTVWTVTNGGNVGSFKMTSSSFTASAGSLAVNGTGILNLTGYLPTVGTFGFTTQTPTLAGPLFFFSATSAPVPVPAALFFVAPALLGVFGVSRRKTNA